jgi:hypothetical protein
MTCEIEPHLGLAARLGHHVLEVAGDVGVHDQPGHLLGQPGLGDLGAEVVVRSGVLGDLQAGEVVLQVLAHPGPEPDLGRVLLVHHEGEEALVGEDPHVSASCLSGERLLGRWCYG